MTSEITLPGRSWGKLMRMKNCFSLILPELAFIKVEMLAALGKHKLHGFLKLLSRQNYRDVT